MIDVESRNNMYDSAVTRQMQGTYMVPDREKQALRNEIKNLQTKLCEKAEENRKLQSEVQVASDKRKEELSIQRERAANIINEYAAKFRKREAEVIVLRTSLMDLKWQCMEAQEVCTDVLESFRCHREGVRSDADQALKQRLKEYELKLSTAQKKIRALEDELKESNEKRDRISKLEHDLESYTSVQETKIASMQAQIRELQVKLHAEQVKNSELKRGLLFDPNRSHLLVHDRIDKYSSEGGIADRLHWEYSMSALRDANRESIFSEAKTQSQASHTSDAQNNCNETEDKNFLTALPGRFESHETAAIDRSEYTSMRDSTDGTNSSSVKVRFPPARSVSHHRADLEGSDLSSITKERDEEGEFCLEHTDNFAELRSFRTIAPRFAMRLPPRDNDLLQRRRGLVYLARGCVKVWTILSQGYGIEFPTTAAGLGHQKSTSSADGMMQLRLDSQPCCLQQKGVGTLIVVLQREKSGCPARCQFQDEKQQQFLPASCS
eukprot:759497-Hanusia_phi.AAC.5